MFRFCGFEGLLSWVFLVVEEEKTPKKIICLFYSLYFDFIYILFFVFFVFLLWREFKNP